MLDNNHCLYPSLRYHNFRDFIEMIKTIQSSLVGGLGISTNLLEGADSSIVAPLLSGELDDGLMSRAKDTGKCLYAYLKPEERIEKINSMVNISNKTAIIFIFYTA